MPLGLSDRLRQVISGSVPRVAPTSADSAEPPAPAPARGVRVDLERIADTLAGQVYDTPNGAVVVVDRYYSADRWHGRERIGSLVETLDGSQGALDLVARAWPRRDRTLDDGARRHEDARVRPRLCFLDLETTGLAGGAGTQAFLVGCAVLEDGGIRVRQFLLPGFEHERALLALVAEWTAAQGTLVTFNGRSFDVPLIETRYLLHRLPFPLAAMPHLDMLYPSRRLWRQRPSVAGPPLDDDCCKLTVLERHLASYHRIGDVPGFDIPSRYFRFVRSGDAHGLEAVLEHNRIDLVSLAVVTARVCTLIARGPAVASHPGECLGLGRLFERAGRTDDAEASFAAAAAMAGRIGRQPDVEAEALRRLALIRRRQGRMREAAEAWERLLAVAACPSVLRREAREALAIHHEHRSRDLAAARLLVLDVLAEPSAPRCRERASYRLQRLERKLANRRLYALPIFEADDGLPASE